MYLLFNRKNSTSPDSPSLTQLPPTADTPVSLSSVLPPSLTVPPIPHPSPHRRLRIFAGADGLYIRPDLPTRTPPSTYLKIAWGKTTEMQEVASDDVDEANSKGLIILGIVGILRLYSSTLDSDYLSRNFVDRVVIPLASYLLVITSRSDVGTCTCHSRL